MARGKQSAKSNNNAFSKQMNRQPLVKPEHMGAFQQECKRVLQKLCDDKSTTIINVSDRFEKLYWIWGGKINSLWTLVCCNNMLCFLSVLFAYPSLP